MRASSRSVAFVVGVAALIAALSAGSYLLGASQQNRLLASGSASWSDAALTDSQRVDAPASADYDGAADAQAVKLTGGAPAVEAQSGSSVDRLMIVTATMDVRVDDLEASLSAVRTSVSKRGGEITAMNMSTGEDPGQPVSGATDGRSLPAGPSRAIVTVRVPAQALDALRADVSRIGRVMAESADANDVTEQAIDLEARLANLRVEEARLRTFVARADKVSDLLAVDRELARVRGEIESMDAQLTYLKRQAQRATLTVALEQPGPVVYPATTGWNLRQAVARGFEATAELVSAAVTVAIPLASVAVAAALIGYPVRALVRRRRRTSGGGAGEVEGGAA